MGPLWILGPPPTHTHTKPHLIQQLMGNGILTTRTKQPILHQGTVPMDEVYRPEPKSPSCENLCKFSLKKHWEYPIKPFLKIYKLKQVWATVIWRNNHGLNHWLGVSMGISYQGTSCPPNWKNGFLFFWPLFPSPLGQRGPEYTGSLVIDFWHYSRDS